MIIAGKEVSVKFNNYAIEQLPTVKGTDKSQFAFVSALIWCGYLGWCYAKQNDPVLTFEDVSDWADSSVNDDKVAEDIKAIYELYTASQAYQKMQKKSEE